LRQFAPCAQINREPTAAEQEELDALATRGAELEQQAQALVEAPEWSPDEAELIDLEEHDIESRRKAIHEALKTWAPEAKAHARFIFTVSREGDIEIFRGVVRDADRKALTAAVPSNDYSRVGSALQLSPQLSAYVLEAAADDLKGSRAWKAIQQTKEAWRARLPQHQGEWLAWLIGLSPAELIECPRDLRRAGFGSKSGSPPAQEAASPLPRSLTANIDDVRRLY